MIKFLMAIVFLCALPLNSSAVMEGVASKIAPTGYNLIFQPLGVAKAIRRLSIDGGQILISKIYVGNKIKRPKLIAQFTDSSGVEHDIDSAWLQPSLVHFMRGDRALLKWRPHELLAIGFSDTLLKELE